MSGDQCSSRISIKTSFVSPSSWMCHYRHRKTSLAQSQIQGAVGNVSFCSERSILVQVVMLLEN
jgi:hypothetical protein